MQRLSGCLWEVVTYKNRTTGVSSDKKSGRVYFNEENLLHAISKLRHVQLHVVTKALRTFEVG